MKKNYKDFNGNDASITALEGASRYKINILIQKVKNGSNMSKEFKLPEDLDEFNIHIKDELKIKFKKNPKWMNVYTRLYCNKMSTYDTSRSISSLIETYSSLSIMNEELDLLFDRDNQRHLKNCGATVVDFFDAESLEDVNDKLVSIVAEQKAKKMIQKIYSAKYKFLVNKNTVNSFKLLIEENVTLSDINNTFGNKIARFKTKDDHDKALIKYTNELFGWDKNTQLKKLKDNNVKIVSSENDVVIAKISNYKQSEEVGSGAWCISYSEKYFKDYRKTSNNIYFIYDFEKDKTDNSSMLGVVLNKNAEVQNAHWRNDDEALIEYDHYMDECTEEEYANNPDDIEYNKYIKLLPKSFTAEEINENILNIIRSCASNKMEMAVNEAMSDELYDFRLLYELMNTGELEKDLNANDIYKLEEIYHEKNILKNSKNGINNNKKIEKFFNTYLDYIDTIDAPLFGNMISEIKAKKDFALLEKLVLKNTGNYDFDELLSIPLNNSKQDVDNLLRIIDKNENKEMFGKHTTGMAIAMLLHTEKENLKYFAKNIVSRCEDIKITPVFSKYIGCNSSKMKEVTGEALKLIIRNSNKESLKEEWNDISVLYKIDDDDPIKKLIENKIKPEKKKAPKLK